MAVKKVTKAPKPKGSPAKKSYAKTKSSVSKTRSKGSTGSQAAKRSQGIANAIYRVINGNRVPIAGGGSNDRKKKN